MNCPTDGLSRSALLARYRFTSAATASAATVAAFRSFFGGQPTEWVSSPSLPL
jgi:hypothetical protein